MPPPSKPLLTRRRLLTGGLGLFGLGAACVAYGRGIESDWLELTRKTVPVAGLARPLCVLHLSDLHVSSCVPMALIARAVDAGLAEKPDLICLTGDLVTGGLWEPAALTAQLRRLSAAAPTFACEGNHDTPCLEPVRDLLADADIPLLLNERQTVAAGGQTVAVVGVRDWWSGACDPEGILPAVRKEAVPTLLLSHNPDSKSVLLARDFDLMLSGHTHGGQGKLLGWAPIVPVRDKSFIEGLRAFPGAHGTRHVHITRGVGNLHGIRFCCRPEVSILELRQPA